MRGRLRAPVIMAVIVVVLSLSPILISCSSEGSKGEPGEAQRSGESHRDGATRTEQTGSARTGDAGEPSGNHRSEPQAALVPIAHVSSTLENVSMQELSRARGLAVGRGFREEAGQLAGRSEFESYDSAGAVVDHVSRTPEALGLVPWDEVGPRVKVLSVDGNALLDPDTAGPESYPLKQKGATVPEPGKLRRVVVAGDVVLDRGQNYMVIQQGMGLDFPLDGGYAAITSRMPEPSYYSETGVVHQFTAERTGGSGAVREYLHGADLTLANFENPLIRNAVWHPDATTFTGDLRLMPVLDQAGID
ncbi:MAG TPA: hypothetical protein VJ827_01620, partial [Rubrobacter sp.]|nr:hypothetical protein [Rubrobacter sp.]